jgi:hypothetical protein
MEMQHNKPGSTSHHKSPSENETWPKHRVSESLTALNLYTLIIQFTKKEQKLGL